MVDDLETWYGFWGLKVYISYINYAPELALTHFTARSNCLLCLYQASSQVSVYRTVGLLVLFIMVIVAC